MIGLMYDDIFLQHVNPPGHPERVERLAAIRDGLQRKQLWDALSPVVAEAADDTLLALVHNPRYVESASKLAGHDGYLDGDTYISAQSLPAARKAAGGAAKLARQIQQGELQSGLALVRPPGHHAEAAEAMGFCIFNNVAVAAAELRRNGAARVAILDWDVHHGNGTQHMFESDPNVLFISTHQYPFYPGTGAADEMGKGEGKGFTVNLPLPAGCGDAEYVDAMDTIILPVLEQYRPDVILVSAGFDAYIEDPLGGMRITASGYQALAARVRALADGVCGGKIMYLLEGGYDLTGLTEGVAACASDLLAPKAPSSIEGGKLTKNYVEVKERVIRLQKDHWKL